MLYFKSWTELGMLPLHFHRFRVFLQLPVAADVASAEDLLEAPLLLRVCYHHLLLLLQLLLGKERPDELTVAA